MPLSKLGRRIAVSTAYNATFGLACWKPHHYPEAIFGHAEYLGSRGRIKQAASAFTKAAHAYYEAGERFEACSGDKDELHLERLRCLFFRTKAWSEIATLNGQLKTMDPVAQYATIGNACFHQGLAHVEFAECQKATGDAEFHFLRAKDAFQAAIENFKAAIEAEQRHKWSSASELCYTSSFATNLGDLGMAHLRLGEVLTTHVLFDGREAKIELESAANAFTMGAGIFYEIATRPQGLAMRAQFYGNAAVLYIGAGEACKKLIKFTKVGKSGISFAGFIKSERGKNLLSARQAFINAAKLFEAEYNILFAQSRFMAAKEAKKNSDEAFGNAKRISLFIEKETGIACDITYGTIFNL